MDGTPRGLDGPVHRWLVAHCFPLQIICLVISDLPLFWFLEAYLNGNTGILEFSHKAVS